MFDLDCKYLVLFLISVGLVVGMAIFWVVSTFAFSPDQELYPSGKHIYSCKEGSSFNDTNKTCIKIEKAILVK